MNTRENPLLLQITLLGKGRIRLVGIDAAKPKTIYFEREKRVDTEAVIHIAMPITPQKMHVKVFKKGAVSLTTKLLPLPTKAVGISAACAGFITHASELAEHASYLGDGVYANERGDFPVEFVPKLYSMEGEPIGGPAKVNRASGYITINAPLFRTYSVPVRMFILLHEWMHHEQNSGDETKVDLHALQVYLGLGFPKLEVMNATAGIFQDRPALLKRVEILYEYLRKYQENPTCNQKFNCAIA